MAAWTLALSGVSADLRLGSLYEPVAADSFDMITTNPPFVMSPVSSDARQRLVYRESGCLSDGLMRTVVSEAGQVCFLGGDEL